MPINITRNRRWRGRRPTCLATSWSFPIHIVPKPNGQRRVTIDYHALNRITQRDAYPIPCINNLINLSARSSYFTSLDFLNRLWQIPVKEAHKPFTAFSCRYGHFKWNIMPLGLTNAPATFQRAMNDILAAFIDCCCVVYLNNITMYSPTKGATFQGCPGRLQNLRTGRLRPFPPKMPLNQPRHGQFLEINLARPKFPNNAEPADREVERSRQALVNLKGRRAAGGHNASQQDGSNDFMVNDAEDFHNIDVVISSAKQASMAASVQKAPPPCSHHGKHGIELHWVNASSLGPTEALRPTLDQPGQVYTLFSAAQMTTGALTQAEQQLLKAIMDLIALTSKDNLERIASDPLVFKVFCMTIALFLPAGHPCHIPVAPPSNYIRFPSIGSLSFIGYLSPDC